MSRPIIAPYITAWSAERDLPYRLITIPGVGIGYADETHRTAIATASSGTAPQTIPAKATLTSAASTHTANAEP
jgi:hypothetical protein